MAATYSGADKRLQYLFTHGGGGGGATNLYGTTPPDSSITAPDGSLYIQYDANSGAVVALYAMIEQVWEQIALGENLLIQDAAIYNEEEKQVGVWIDGRPLYQKTFAFLNRAISTGVNTLTTLTTLGYREITEVRGIMTNSAHTGFFVLNCYGNEDYFVNYLHITDAGELNLHAGDTWPTPNIYITIRYTKTADAAGSGGYKAYGFSPVIYSEEEREVGVWIDGRPLYQKTAAFGSIGAGSQTVPMGISNVGDVVALSATAVLPNGSLVVLPLTYANTSLIPNYGVGVAEYNPTTGNVTLNIGADRTLSRGYITLQYTKTTDTPGSGTYTTTGAPAHHYSTQEQVVGTWIDGKPVYEKTIEVPSVNIPANSQTLKALSDYISDCKAVMSIKGVCFMDGNYFNIPYDAQSSQRFSILVNRNLNYLSFSRVGGAITADFTLTLRYTKTTD